MEKGSMKGKESEDAASHMKYQHSWWKICLIIGFVPAIALAGISSSVFQDWGIVQRSIGKTTDLVDLHVIPSGSTFSIWAFIWIWQIAIIVYFFIAIFRKTSENYLYQHPVFQPIVYVLNIISYLASAGWVVSFDRLELGWSFVCLATMPIVLFTSIGFSAKRLKDQEEHLVKIGNRTDFWLWRLLVHNGIAFYGTWVTIASLLNLGMLIAYRWGGSQLDANMTVLGCLTAITMAFFMLDNILLYDYIQFIVSPYIVIIVALRGVLVRSWDMDSKRELSIFTAVLLSVVGVALLVKLTIMAARMWRRKSIASARISDVEKS